MRSFLLIPLWVYAVDWGPATSSPATTVHAGTHLSFREAVRSLKARGIVVIQGCRLQAEDGQVIYVPDVDKHYRACWIRDLCYMVEGIPEAFPPAELRGLYLWLLARQGADGAMPDRVEVDGSGTFMPGPRDAPICQDPVADGPQFMVKLAYAVVTRTGDLNLFRQTADALERGMRSLPRNRTNGLIHIARDELRCPYGFTDTVRKKGDLLFCSLLYMEAAQDLANLYRRARLNDKAEAWTQDAERMRGGIESLWDEASGYYVAASERCRQPDVWGTAYAAYLGAAERSRVQRISRQFVKDYSRIVRAGQVRHLPAPMYWEDCLAQPETYQNGGYWATPVGWVYWTIRQSDETLAENLVVDWAHYLRSSGIVPEWSTAGTSALRGYAASVAAPIAVLDHDSANPREEALIVPPDDPSP